MYIQILVDELKEGGQLIIEALQRARVPMTAAFWYRIPDSGFWRLVIGSRLVDQVGPLEGYRRLHQIIDTLDLPGSFSGSIAFLGVNDPSFQRLRAEALGPGQFNAGPGGPASYNVFQDVFVYSVKPLGAPS